MPPIIEDYAEIKRRMDELNGTRPVSVTIHIDARSAQAGVSDRINDALKRGFARGGIIKPGTPYVVGEKALESFVPVAGWCGETFLWGGVGSWAKPCREPEFIPLDHPLGQIPGPEMILTPEGRALIEKDKKQ